MGRGTICVVFVSIILIGLFITFAYLVKDVHPNVPKTPTFMLEEAPEMTPAEEPLDSTPAADESEKGRRAETFQDSVLDELFDDDHIKLIKVAQKYLSSDENEVSTSNTKALYNIPPNEDDSQKKQLKIGKNERFSDFNETRKTVDLLKADNDNIILKIVNSAGEPTIEIKIMKPVGKKPKRVKTRRVVKSLLETEKREIENKTTTTGPTTVIANTFIIKVLLNDSLLLESPNIYEDSLTNSAKPKDRRSTKAL